MALRPREAEIRAWVEQGRSDAWIGEKLGTSAGSIQSFRFHNSIPRRPTLGDDELARLRAWVEQGKSHAWIGERIGKTAAAVAALCSRYGISSPYRFSPQDVRKVHTWVGQGRSDPWIAEELGRTEQSIAALRRREGILHGVGALKGREADIERWVAEGFSDDWIARKLGSTRGGVATFRSINGIRRNPTCTNRVPSIIAERERNHDAVRRAIAELCESGDGASYAQLATHTGLNKKTVMRHVHRMREEGLVQIAYRRIQGRRVAEAKPVVAASDKPARSSG